MMGRAPYPQTPLSLPPRYLFAEAWNSVVEHLRLSDAVSDAEGDMLKFDHFGETFSKPVYLPVFQTAGALDLAAALAAEHAAKYRVQHSHAVEHRDRRLSYLEEAAPVAALPGALNTSGFDDDVYAGTPAATQRKLFQLIAEDVTLSEAVNEAYELLAWLIRRLLGEAHASDALVVAEALNKWATSEDILQHVRLENVQGVIATATKLVTTLHKALPKRKPRKPSATKLATAGTTDGAGAGGAGGAAPLELGARVGHRGRRRRRRRRRRQRPASRRRRRRRRPRRAAAAWASARSRRRGSRRWR